WNGSCTVQRSSGAVGFRPKSCLSLFSRFSRHEEIEVMSKAWLAASLSAALCLYGGASAWAHGGNYKGPSDTVPPNLGGGGDTTPPGNPGGPGTPAGPGPTTPGSKAGPI